MTWILPYFSDCILILVGLYAALLGFKVINLRKDNVEYQKKMEIWHLKFGKFMKIGGIFLIILGLINVISSLEKKDNIGWTIDQKEQLMDKVINSSIYLKSINADTAKLIAKCVVDKYTDKYTIKDSYKNDKLPQDQYLQLIVPIATECLKQYLNKPQSP